MTTDPLPSSLSQRSALPGPRSDTDRVPAADADCPPLLAAALLRAIRAERSASGSHRRVAFRRTRALLSGARQLGVNADTLADLLGCSSSSVRVRGSGDGWLGLDDIAVLTGLSNREIARWRASGRLPAPEFDAAWRERYRAQDVAGALCRQEA